MTQEAAATAVSAAWPEVVRTAYLLTADHGTAEELAAAAFVQQRRRGLAPSADVVRRLVLTLPSSLGAQLVTGSPRRPDPGDPFLAAYLGLSARERALLVLRVAEGIDGAAAAATLGLRPKDARASTVSALDTLRAAPLPVVGRTSRAELGTAAVRRGAPPASELDLGELTPSVHGDDRTGGDPLAGDPVVPRLGALFAELSAAPPVVTDPARRVDEAAALSRRRRRRLAVVAAGMVVTVVGHGAVLENRRADDRAEQQRAERRRAAEAALIPVVEGSDVTRWPTRGSLSGRTDLLAQVRAVAAKGEAGRVLAVPFLGEVAGRDVALAITTGLGDEHETTQRLVALVGSAAQPMASWERTENDLESESGGRAGPMLSAVLGGSDGRVRAVVVTVSSGVTAAFSPRPRINVDGVVTRRYTRVALHNGVGTLAWRGSASGAVMRVQFPSLPPSFGRAQLINWQDRLSRAPLRSVVGASCRGGTFAGLRRNLDNVAEAAAAEAGRGADEVERVQAIGCRRVGNHAVMIIGMRLVDGTALQTELEQITRRHGLSQPRREVRAVPRGRDVTYPRFVRLSLADDLPPVARQTILFSAPGGATAELLVRFALGGSEVVATARLSADGIGRATTPVPLDEVLGREGNRLLVVVRDAAGRDLERVPAPGGHELRSETLDGPVDPPGVLADDIAFPHRR